MKPLTKAYRNAEFLNGDSARTVRMLCEYLEPQARLEQFKVNRAIIFFGSARLRPLPAGAAAGTPDYCAAAAQLGERLARWTVDTHAPPERYHVVTGGGPGIMEAVHAGSERVDRRLNVGLNISLPFEQHLNPYVDPDRAFEFHYFFMRKFWFMNLSHAFVIFPGGYGTLDELFEVLTLTQVGKAHKRPIVLYGSEFWRDTLNFEGLLKRELISPEDLEMFSVADSVDEAFTLLVRGLQALPVEAAVPEGGAKTD